MSSPDVLSSVLGRLTLESTVVGAFDLADDFTIETGDYTGLKLYLVLKGDFWLKVKGERKIRQIREGDCVLLPSGKSLTISKQKEPGSSAQLSSLLRKSVNGTLTLNGGGEFLAIGIHFLFSGHFAEILFSHLPTVIHVLSQSDQAISLRWNIERFRSEYWSQNLGRSMVLEHLAPIILLQTLRSHIATATSNNDWLAALSNPKLSRAIAAMHADVKRPWTLESIAKVAGMSRSSFATNFRKQVGLYPIEYLTHWRIHIACQMLASGSYNVSETAEQIGYSSESAFSTAFMRIVKTRPGKYGREQAK